MRNAKITLQMQLTHRDLLHGVDFWPTLGVPKWSLGDPWPQSDPRTLAPDRKNTQITSGKWGDEDTETEHA